MDYTPAVTPSRGVESDFRERKQALLAVALAEVCRRRMVRAAQHGDLDLTAQELDRLRLLRERIASGAVSETNC